MNQNTVEKLHEYGAFLVLLDVPKGTEFSIDWNSWKGFFDLNNFPAQKLNFKSSYLI